MELKLRKAQCEELEVLQNFVKDVINKNYRGFLGNDAVDHFIESGASDEYILENISNITVALLKDEMVGICVCKENLIDLIMTHSEMHRQGIGSKLITQISEELLKTYNIIHLESFESNVKANAFYDKNNWNKDKIVFDEEVGVNKIYYSKCQRS